VSARIKRRPALRDGLLCPSSRDSVRRFPFLQTKVTQANTKVSTDTFISYRECRHCYTPHISLAMGPTLQSGVIGACGGKVAGIEPRAADALRRGEISQSLGWIP
jgi:hypothetical protein